MALEPLTHPNRKQGALETLPARSPSRRTERQQPRAAELASPATLRMKTLH